MRGQRAMLYRYAVLQGRTLIGIYDTYEIAEDYATVYEIAAYINLGHVVDCDIITIGYGGLLRHGGNHVQLEG